MKKIILEGIRKLQKSVNMKFVSALLVLLTYLTCAPLYSLPVSNASEAAFYSEGLWVKPPLCHPCDCHFFNIRFGYYGDFVFNRNLEIRGEGLDQGRVIQFTKMNRNAALFVFNFFDSIDLFATVGASRITVTTTEQSWLINGLAEGTLFTNSHLAWSVGGKAPIFHWNCLNFGLEGQYFESYPRIIQYISSFVGDYTSFENNNSTTYREWQVGTVMSYIWHISCPDIAISPYIAGKWSGCRWDTHNFSFIGNPSGELFTIFNLQNHKWWGAAFGTTFLFYNVAGVTVEGRVGDEVAFSVNAQFSF